MKGIRLTITFIIWAGVLAWSQAQVIAPDFQCVRNDTLFWQPQANPCGAFERYEIYASQDIEGPYSLLSSIANPATTQFYHSGITNEVWYYYLTAVHDCPGQTITTSDTLDNLIPVAGVFHFVSVENGNVVLHWQPSPSVETVAYVISRIGALGLAIIDTVYSDTTYLDTGASPTIDTETYFIESLDACGNKSLIPPPHTTMLMGFTPPDACSPGLVLNWSAYVGWAGGVSQYDIFVGVDGGMPVQVGSVPGSEATFTFNDTNDGETLCFYVEAVEGTTPYRSRSQQLCTTVSIVQPIREVLLLGASVNEQAGVDVEWWWDERARVDAASLLRETLDIPLVLSSPPTAFNTWLDEDVAQMGSVTYRISVLDECGNRITSNPSPTPFLMGRATGEGNILEWEAYDHPLAFNLRYELVRLGTGEVAYTGGDLKFTDLLNAGTEVQTCYLLRVNADFALSSGEVVSRTMRSNTLCLQPSPRVYVPNVFAPDGANSIFRPQLSLGLPTEYELAIFDRWGGQVFQSTAIEAGWNGTRNGEPLPQGIYLYFVRMTGPNGEAIDIQGDVMLLR